jgi:type IV pilus assembly protein PilM
MKLFEKNLTYLGVDIGTTSIKIVELKNESGRPRLMSYGYVEEPVDIIHDSSEKTIEKASKIILKIIKESKMESKKIVASLPSFSVFSSTLSLPQMNSKDLPQAIYWQAKKFVPLAIEDMTLDWKILSNKKQKNKSEIKIEKNKINSSEKSDFKKDENKKMEGISNLSDNKEKNIENKPKKANDIKVLIAAAPKKLVMRYIDVFKRAELEVLSLETENFAMERSLVGGEKNPIMIVDIGSSTTDISVVEQGMPLLNRSVDVGGKTITKTIMNSLNVNEKRAEQFKRDIGFSKENNSLPKVIENIINPIINEIKYSFDLYASHGSNKKIEKIILSGGSAFLPQLDSYLENLLKIKVYIGDPWSRIVYPLELKPVLKELAPRFGVSVGLAMREIV